MKYWCITVKELITLRHANWHNAWFVHENNNNNNKSSNNDNVAAIQPITVIIMRDFSISAWDYVKLANGLKTIACMHFYRIETLCYQ